MEFYLPNSSGPIATVVLTEFDNEDKKGYGPRVYSTAMHVRVYGKETKFSILSSANQKKLDIGRHASAPMEKWHTIQGGCIEISTSRWICRHHSRL